RIEVGVDNAGLENVDTARNHQHFTPYRRVGHRPSLHEVAHRKINARGCARAPAKSEVQFLGDGVVVRAEWSRRLRDAVLRVKEPHGCVTRLLGDEALDVVELKSQVWAHRIVDKN